MKIETYEDAAREWRWRLRAPNGRILCDGAEGYATKPGVRRAIANFVKHLNTVVPVIEVRVRHVVVEEPIRVRRPRAQARKAA